MAADWEALKILIVDDSEIDLDILELILNQLGFKNITKTGSGKEAFKLAEKNLPDLIFIDIMMPGIDGGALKQLLDDNTKTKDIPTIFVSAIIKKDEQKSIGELAGGRIIIAKPFSADEISKAIDVVFSRS